MQVFKAALRVYTKHLNYLLIYVVALSALGVFIGKSMAPQAPTFKEDRPTIAIIDRDGSVFSRGFTSFLSTHGTVVRIEDTRASLQDATAQNYATWIAVIPAGFGQDFLDCAAQGRAAPQIQTIVSYDSASGSLMNQLANAYLNTARVYGASGTTTDQHELVRFTTADMSKSARVALISPKNAVAPSHQYQTFLLFSAYTTMMSIIVCVGLIMIAFNRTELRKRNLASPVSSLARNLQMAAACLVVMLVSWAWVSVLGLVVFGNTLTGVPAGVIAMLLLSLLVNCVVSLALGFFIGQLSSNELVLNAVGVIFAQVFGFLGGIWIDTSLMSSGIRTIGRFIPFTYYTEALSRLTALKALTASTLGPVFADLGMILLFAAAIFAVALAVGRLRMQSSAAGGNAAAARSVV